MTEGQPTRAQKVVEVHNLSIEVHRLVRANAKEWGGA